MNRNTADGGNFASLEISTPLKYIGSCLPHVEKPSTSKTISFARLRCLERPAGRLGAPRRVPWGISGNYWVAVKELNLSYNNSGETLLSTISTHYGNLI